MLVMQQELTDTEKNFLYGPNLFPVSSFSISGRFWLLYCSFFQEPFPYWLPPLCVPQGAAHHLFPTSAFLLPNFVRNWWFLLISSRVVSLLSVFLWGCPSKWAPRGHWPGHFLSRASVKVTFRVQVWRPLCGHWLTSTVSAARPSPVLHPSSWVRPSLTTLFLPISVTADISNFPSHASLLQFHLL